MTKPMTDQQLQAILERNNSRKRYSYCQGTQDIQDIVHCWVR